MFIASEKTYSRPIVGKKVDTTVKETAKRQLCTSVPLKLYHEKIKRFVGPSAPFRPIVDHLNGLISGEEYLAFSHLDDKREECLIAGLNDEEILFKLKCDSDPKSVSFKYTTLSRNRLDEINQVLDSHKSRSKHFHPDDYDLVAHAKRQLKPQINDPVLIMSLKNVDAGLSQVANQLSDDSSNEEEHDRLLKTDNALESELLEDTRSENCRQTKGMIGPQTKRQNFESLKFYLMSSAMKGFCIRKNDIMAINPNDMAKFKMNDDDIRKIQTFASWQIGQPNNTLFVKNLPKNISEELFVALFIHFQNSDEDPLIFRLCTGRMRGQGFVRFPTIKAAELALRSVNGFLIKANHKVKSCNAECRAYEFFN